MAETIVIPRNRWPKQIPPLTPEQQVISNDFMHYWHEVLPKRYGLIEQFNHQFPLRSLPATGRVRTLEIGAGRGSHLHFEDLSRQEYYTVELRDNMAEDLRQLFPNVNVVVGDCQDELPFEDGFFDRVLAIHVLEHLPRLPDAVAQVARMLKPGGTFAVVLPCDPGLAYEVARKISAERIFRRRYKQSYDWFIRREHINSPSEIISVLERHFTIRERSFFPFRVPIKDINLCIGLLATRRETATS
jgi:SAM-dependent methyltransferase